MNNSMNSVNFDAEEHLQGLGWKNVFRVFEAANIIRVFENEACASTRRLENTLKTTHVEYTDTAPKMMRCIYTYIYIYLFIYRYIHIYRICVILDI